MKMKRISKYFFNIAFVLVFTLTQGQTKDSIATADKTELAVQDTSATKINRYGLRVGVDLFKLSKSFWDHNYKGIELVGDYRIAKRYFAAAELGTENKTTEDDRLTSKAKGSYLKVGFDYNTYENWGDMENLISVGMRLGFSSFNQDLLDYKIYNRNPYWGELPPVQVGESFSGLSASWIEVNAGLKAKVINNIFVGFSFQLKRLLHNKKPDGFDNLYIPGFNRTYDGEFGIGFNYSVSYFIPLYKKKIKIDTEE